MRVIQNLKGSSHKEKRMAAIHCSKCKDPASYSFKKISDKNGLCIFYTNPAKARIFKEHEGLLEHFQHMTAQNATKKWKWVFDGEGFDTDHMFELSVGLELLALFKDVYRSQLQEIIIINPSIHIKVIVKLLMQFTDDEFQSKLTMKDDRTYSILEFL